MSDSAITRLWTVGTVYRDDTADWHEWPVVRLTETDVEVRDSTRSYVLDRFTLELDGVDWPRYGEERARDSAWGTPPERGRLCHHRFHTDAGKVEYEETQGWEHHTSAADTHSTDYTDYESAVLAGHAKLGLGPDDTVWHDDLELADAVGAIQRAFRPHMRPGIDVPSEGADGADDELLARLNHGLAHHGLPYRLVKVAAA